MKIRFALRHVRTTLAAAILTAASTGSAMGYQASTETAQELLNDFTHYAMVGHVELAIANARALLDSGISNAELATLLDEGKVTLKRFDDAISRAQMVPALEAIAGELSQRVEAGRLDMARDPKRIDEAIKMLTGTQRARTIAKQRLAAAKEYAVPALLRKVTEGNDEAQRLACHEMLVQIGGPAVLPLCEALPHLTGASQRAVCDILGAIRYATAAPYLREVALNESAEQPNRDAAARAFKNVGGEELPLSTLYSNLAKRYFKEQQSLIVFPTEPMNNIWSYSNITGLTPTPVSTAIFSEIMTMRVSGHALRVDATNTEAIDLFVAGNLKRENDMADGDNDPIYGSNPYSPEFYATVFGTQTCMNVLAMGIDSLDTPLVRDAIQALSKTTGGSNLINRGSGRQPLLEALNYPDRRVKYEAALTLGNALPSQGFAGESNVVPILASAVRMSNKTLVLVINDSEENRRSDIAELERLGFEIVGAGANLPAVHADVARAVGIDLISVRMSNPDETRKVVAALRTIPKTSAAPVIIIGSELDRVTLQSEFREDRRVNLVRAGVDAAAFGAAVESVMQSAAGGRMTEAEAEEYAIRALSTLRDIAITRTSVYQIADAESALADALSTRSGATRQLVADILALVDTESAQRSLFDAALAAQDDDKVYLLGCVADSVRTFGDRAEKWHVESLLEIIAKANGELAEAAAAVHGALNLPTSGAVELIPKS